MTEEEKKEPEDQKVGEQKTKKDFMDYHYDCVKPEVIRLRNKIISDRWSELHGFYMGCGDEIKKYLFYVNAGGAGAVLGFMGASEAVRTFLFVRISLCCFALGLILVGILRAVETNMARSFFNNWQKDVASYYGTRLSFSELERKDIERTNSELWLYILGYLSGVSFIAGVFFGGISFY